MLWCPLVLPPSCGQQGEALLVLRSGTLPVVVVLCAFRLRAGPHWECLTELRVAS